MASYTGLRSISARGNRVLLNGKPLYQRLVLDQGYYPEGIWTAPSDADLKRDIELAIAAGFNGARLHQKVFEERFHYWADRLGYLTWAESASWGMDVSKPQARYNFLCEWRDCVRRDRNHPSIIAWTPLNETRHRDSDKYDKRFQSECYELTKTIDPSRPINDASGWAHANTDLWTIHDYTQDPEKLREKLQAFSRGEDPYAAMSPDASYAGQPVIIDEMGGTRWSADNKQSWGYGNAPTNAEDYYQRIAGLIAAIRSIPEISGFTFTQLYDVEQEQNGIYTYQRLEKFDMKRIRTCINPHNS